MPIDHKPESTRFYQREQYQKNGLSRWYWDFKDGVITGLIRGWHQNILDVGCGEGILLEKLLGQFPGRNIRGLDVMPENIKICQTQQLPVFWGSVYDLPVPAGSIDLCIVSEVIEHLENADSALENIKRVLKKGGEVIIVFPNDRVFKITRLLFLRLKEAFACLGHLKQFTPLLVRQLLRKHGLVVQKIKNTPFGFWPLSLHCIILAKKR